MRFRLISIIFILMMFAVASSAEVAVTVYNQDLALIKDQRALEFKKGAFELSLTDVPDRIDPTSVHFKLMDNPEKVALLEQNYRYDLVDFNKILEKYLDREIEMVDEKGEMFSGKLLAHNRGAVTLMKPSGGLQVLMTDKLSRYSFPSLPEGLITKPTLVWLLDSDLAGKHEAEVSYLTKGMNWHAEYVGVVSEDETDLSLAGWVSIENNSGATYPEAKLKLVAGDVNIIEDKREFLMAAYEADYGRAAKAAPGFEEKAFFEYHLYTLPRATTIADNEIKQISLFEPAVTLVKKIYLFEGNRSQGDIKVSMEFVNSKSNGLGMPLPAGKVRIMKRDSDGAMEFVGEDLIDHTPRDEKIDLYLGNAFDLVGERKVIDSRRVSKQVQEEDIEISLKNRKEAEAVTILVREKLYARDWEIQSSNFEYQRPDANTIEFKVPVEAGQEVVVKYTVRRVR
ncbi:MAG: DUF4139 domain-containing protein [candidate division Zixibacteria bacterium]|nr:DUF4139 domain-containing protein [candidate division Zixibacteria bacterium]